MEIAGHGGGLIGMSGCVFSCMAKGHAHYLKRPTTPILPKQFWFGLVPFRSPLLWESLFVFFSTSYLDVSDSFPTNIVAYHELLIHYIFA